MNANSSDRSSQPPPESAGQGLSDERAAFERNEALRPGFGSDTLARYGHDCEQYQLPLVQARFEGWMTHSILAANPTAQPDGGSKA